MHVPQLLYDPRVLGSGTPQQVAGRSSTVRRGAMHGQLYACLSRCVCICGIVLLPTNAIIWCRQQGSNCARRDTSAHQ